MLIEEIMIILVVILIIGGIIYLINKFLHKKVSQLGMGILLSAYLAVSIFHYYIFVKVITG